MCCQNFPAGVGVLVGARRGGGWWVNSHLRFDFTLKFSGRVLGAMPVTGTPRLSSVTGGRTVTGIRVWSESSLDCSSQRATQALCFS